MLFEYDDTSIESIYNYAKKLEGMTFNEVYDEYKSSSQKYYINPKESVHQIAEPSAPYGDSIQNEHSKGQLGSFLERFYFGYMPNSIQDADFSKTGIELKQTCIDKKKNGSYTAGERLSITNISYKEPVEDDFYKSHVWQKIKRILLIHYLRDKSKDRFDYQIKFVNLFTPPKEDLQIITQDYAKIISKIKAGKAHELSESETFYLGACTKGASKAKSTVPQFYGQHIPAMKRNFCFKRKYMDYILHEYVEKDNVPCESIIKINHFDTTLSFEEQILSIINNHIGQTDKELCEQYNRPYNNNKSQWVDITYKMLGIKSNQAEEFLKANIVVKTIRLEQDGHMRESMSFPTLNFKKFVQTDFEESDFCRYFEETRFLFVIFKHNGASYVLKGAQMWNMSHQDLYGDAQIGWNAIHDKIASGVTFTINGNKISNDLPSKTDNRILHIRPHTQHAAYKLHTGFEKGNIQKDGDQLPDGEWMTKQSLWLNNSYIMSQLKYK